MGAFPLMGGQEEVPFLNLDQGAISCHQALSEDPVRRHLSYGHVEKQVFPHQSEVYSLLCSHSH